MFVTALSTSRRPGDLRFDFSQPPAPFYSTQCSWASIEMNVSLSYVFTSVSGTFDHFNSFCFTLLLLAVTVILLTYCELLTIWVNLTLFGETAINWFYESRRCCWMRDEHEIGLPMLSRSSKEVQEIVKITHTCEQLMCPYTPTQPCGVKQYCVFEEALFHF